MESSDTTTPSVPIVLITGFFGAGKTAFAEALLRDVDGLAVLRYPEEDTDTLRALTGRIASRPGASGIVVEVSGDTDPLEVWRFLAGPAQAQVSGIVAIADGVNLPDLLSGPARDWVSYQIGCASRIHVSRTDLLAPDKARAMLRSLTDAPETGPEDPFSPTTLRELPPVDPPRLTRWSYEGAALVSRDDLERLLRRPPAGLWRLAGTVRTDRGAVSVDLSGRCVGMEAADTDQTLLHAIGFASLFRPADLDTALATLVSAHAGRSGYFGYR